jgi:hypothetical protein
MTIVGKRALQAHAAGIRVGSAASVGAGVAEGDEATMAALRLPVAPPHVAVTANRQRDAHRTARVDGRASASPLSSRQFGADTPGLHLPTRSRSGSIPPPPAVPCTNHLSRPRPVTRAGAHLEQGEVEREQLHLREPASREAQLN